MDYPKWVLAVTFSLLFTTCQFDRRADPNSIVVDVKEPVYPVLQGKVDNPLLRLRIQLDSFRTPVTMEQIEVELDNPAPLDSIRIYFTGSTPEFSAANPFGAQMVASKKVIFQGKQRLSPGENHFWLSAGLKENAGLEPEFVPTFSGLVMDGQRRLLADTLTHVPKRLGVALRQHNQDNVHTYRIPGLVTTNQGTLIAVYDLRRNGSVDLQEDIDVGMSRSTDGGQSWEPMKVIMDLGEWGGKPQDQNGIGDPSVLVDRNTNTIWVAAIWAHGQPGKRNWVHSRPGLDPEVTSQLMLTKSEDDGLTWSPLINLTPEIKDPAWHLLLQGPGKGITMRNGTLVFPAQFKDADQIPHSTILYSRNQGRTWQLGTGAKSHTTESQVIELSDGSLMLNMRDDRGSGPDGRNGTGARSVVTTSDLGKTWVEHPTSRKALPEPVCNASLIRHSDLLLFVNPNHRYERKNMTIKVSFDEGMTWPDQYHTLIDEGRGRGYPSLTSIDPNTIGILYEGSQADLIFQRFRLDDLLKRPSTEKQ